MIKLGKYSFGVGDRFTLQGKAQLRAIIRAIVEVKASGLDNKKDLAIGDKVEFIYKEHEKGFRAYQIKKL